MVPAWPKEPRADLKDNLSALDKKRLGDPVITHVLNNPNEDPIINRIHQLGFRNEPNDPVQVIYMPCYLNGNDGIFNMAYYDLLAGMDATAFPSYYEPWGYTPLESVAFGVPTVTTSLSGFGQWILSTSKSDFTESGVEVVNRTDSNYGEVVNNLAADLKSLADADTDYRDRATKAAYATASKAEWNYFITYYIDAFKIALIAADKRRNEPTQL